MVDSPFESHDSLRQYINYLEMQWRDLDQEDPSLVHKIVDLLQEIGDFNKARTYRLFYEQYFQADYFIERASKKEENGDIVGAIKDYESAIELQPYNAHLYFQIASLKFDLNDKEGCLYNLQKAIDLNPQESSYHDRLGLVKLMLFDDLEESISSFSKAIEQDPCYFYYLNRGTAYYYAANFEACVEDINQALKMYIPSKDHIFSCFYFRALAKKELGKIKEALKDCNKAIAFDKSSHKAYFTRASINQDLDNYVDSIVDLEKAISLDSSQYEYFYMLGISRQNLEDFGQAISAYDEALKIQKEKEIYYHRGTCFYEMGEYESALIDFNTVISIDPLYACSYYYCGLISLCQLDFKKAIYYAEKAMALDSTNSSYYKLRGNANLELGKFQESIYDYDKSIAIDPFDPNSYFQRAWAKDDLGDYEGAISDLDCAIGLDANCYAYYFNRAISKKEINDPQGALEDINQAIMLQDQPNLDASLFHFAGQIKQEMGDIEGAINSFEKALQINPCDLELIDLLAKVKEKKTLVESSKLKDGVELKSKEAQYSKTDILNLYTYPIDNIGSALSIYTSSLESFLDKFPELKCEKEISSILLQLQSSEVNVTLLGVHGRRLTERLVKQSIAQEWHRKSLNDCIQHLSRDICLDPVIISSLHFVRTFGNKMVHPNISVEQKTIKSSHVLLLLGHIQHILEEYPWI